MKLRSKTGASELASRPHLTPRERQIVRPGSLGCTVKQGDDTDSSYEELCLNRQTGRWNGLRSGLGAPWMASAAGQLADLLPERK